jgi:glycine/D-amino acid oxidase-like deaminating enzyme
MDTTSSDPVVDVIVIGAGISGVSAVHHLLESCNESSSRVPSLVGTTHNLQIVVIDAGPTPGEGVGSRKSGTATMNCEEPGGMSRIKMMSQIYESDSVEFVKHHGREGAYRYMLASRKGLELQKGLAKEVGKELLWEMGSYFVCTSDEYSELRAEYDFLRSLGDCCDDFEFIEEMDLVEGACPEFPYGIYFPQDAVIDSSEYVKRLMSKCLKSGHVTTRFHTQVVNVRDGQDMCIVTLTNGEELAARHVVVATGAMDPLPQLHGLLVPCYSYLVQIPVSSDQGIQQSANFFTWSDIHDWCFDQGKIRVSGEDHFSAYKDPHLAERCSRMIEWARDRYPCLASVPNDCIPQQYGLYSETPDYVPIIGTRSDESRICFLVGCNAQGQAILSYAASLVPKILGYGGNFDESQKESLRLLSIRRFTELPPSLKYV